MRIQPAPVSCGKCTHWWLVDMVVEGPVELFLAWMKAIKRCPSCGSNKVLMGRGDVPDPDASPDDRYESYTNAERRAAWMKLYDNGQSSECIADVMCCRAATSGAYPHDYADFGRCERLLMLYPSWRARFAKMAGVNLQWAALVERWDEIVEAWKHDRALLQSGCKDGTWLCSALILRVLASAEDVAA